MVGTYPPGQSCHPFSAAIEQLLDVLGSVGTFRIVNAFHCTAWVVERIV